MLIGNKSLYPDGVVPESERNEAFYQRFCVWADENGFSVPEYLLPTIERKTAIGQFRFEQRFRKSGATPPSRDQIDALKPWVYHIEWADVTSRGPTFALDWKVHRYRSSLIVDLAAEIAGPARRDMSVMDVACHCGVLALEFAEAGFGSVTGLDLRPENIRQADFLKQTFDCPNVTFGVENARNIKGHRADIIFCGGLLYHVTFPVELMTDLLEATGQYLIFDTVCQNHPFSGFHINDGRDVNRSLDGDNAVELMPTYRAVIDLMRAAGCTDIYEILGDRAEDVPFYDKRQIRTFIVAKPGVSMPTDLNSAERSLKPVAAGS